MELSPDAWTVQLNTRELRRSFGDSELAFLPASQDGIGDMFLHLSFRAPRVRLHPERILNAWVILRNRHPLLTCQVIEDKKPCLSFSPPMSIREAIEEAKSTLSFRRESRHELILNYMNGPRTLSNISLSCLVISSPSSPLDFEDLNTPELILDDYDLLMCAPHFIGDGTSLHQCTHDFLALLSSPMSNADILSSIDLVNDWRVRLPQAFEARCVVPRDRFARAASKVHFSLAREKEIGGHRFEREQRAPPKTIFVERVFNEVDTKAILRQCKEHGVTINHAIEAVCGVAWAKVIQTSSTQRRDVFKDPVMLYTAINLRSHLAPSSATDPTYWFLALTYFTLVLPSFPPASKAVFWLRAQSAKRQTHRAVQSRFLLHRTLEMASERADRARGTPRPAIKTQALFHPSSVAKSLLPGPAPSTALLGLSLIGNLDAIYTRHAYPDFVLHDVTTASRQKGGGILLLVHTFGGKLWLQLFYDCKGFGNEGQVDRFWDEVGKGVEYFLVN